MPFLRDYNDIADALRVPRDGFPRTATDDLIALDIMAPRSVPIAGLIPPSFSRNCYLWKHFAGSGVDQNVIAVGVPFADQRYAVYRWRIGQPAGLTNWIGADESVAVLNTRHTSAVKVGTWDSTGSTTKIWPSGPGTYSTSSTDGETCTWTVTGHTFILRTSVLATGGYALVAIDGDYTKANLLPVVTQALVDSGDFDVGDKDKRYIDFYSSTQYFDRFIPLAEGLTDASHTVTIEATGKKRAAATGTKAVVVAMCSCSAGVAPNGTNCSFAPLRPVLRLPSNAITTSNTCAISFTPTGYPTADEWAGEYHGNEVEDSIAYVLDDTAFTPAADTFYEGQRICIKHKTFLRHPSTGTANVANRWSNHFYEAGRPWMQRVEQCIQAILPMTLSTSYVAMLMEGVQDTDGNWSTPFTACRLGTYIDPAYATSDGNDYGQVKADVLAFASSAHEMVAWLALPRVDWSVNNWTNSGTNKAFVKHYANGIRKLYATLVGVGQSRSVVAGERMFNVVDYGIARVPDSPTSLGM